MTNDADLKIALDRTALFFDIDGTLLDLAPTPDRVLVPEGLPDTLQDLFRATGGATAFLTGRAISAVDRLFDPLRLPVVGGHGAEFRRAPGAPVEAAAPLHEGLRHGLKGLEMIAPGILVEDKVSTLSIHYRLAPEAGPILRRALDEHRQELNQAGLQILLGKEIIEIKPRLFNKGTGLLRMLRSEPFKGRTPVFFGDDTTDEDAFRVLPELGGVGISVGRRIEGASFMFDTPTTLRKFLSGFAHANGSG